MGDLPVSILLTTYNRLHFLKKSVDLINERTFFPFRLIVVSNHCEDGTLQYLKEMKVIGKVWDYIYMPENKGQSEALNAGFNLVQDWEKNKRRPSSDIIVTTNEDIFVPKLGLVCWLTKMVHLFNKYEKDGLGALSARIERSSRMNIDEEKELIWGYKGIPSVLRLLRRSDLEKLGEKPFGSSKHWESNYMSNQIETVLHKKFAFATHIYASHAGFMEENKGFQIGFTKYLTYAGEHKDNQYIEKPYPIIHPESFIPLKIQHGSDRAEQELRDNYWNNHVDFEDKKEDKNVLGEHVNGVTLDLSSGNYKLNGTITMDYYPFDNVDAVNRIDDLWMFGDESVDTIISVRGLELMADTKKTLTEWYRVLKNGGKLCLISTDLIDSQDTLLKKCYGSSFSISSLVFLLEKIFIFKDLKCCPIDMKSVKIIATK